MKKLNKKNILCEAAVTGFAMLCLCSFSIKAEETDANLPPFTNSEQTVELTVLENEPEAAEENQISEAQEDLLDVTANEENEINPEEEIVQTADEEEQPETEAGGAGTAGYKDITPGDGNWYNDIVFQATEAGIMTGYENGNFGPNDTMTRGMAATILYRLNGSPDVTFVQYYKDVKDANAYYAKATAWLYQNKLMTGYADGSFGAEDAITREQIATILYRQAAANGQAENITQSLKRYTDTSKIDSYAKTAMEWIVQSGILQGRNYYTELSPLSSATRAEAAKIFTLFKEYAASGELELKNTLRVTENSELVYLDENGKSISGWKSTEGATFYFDPNNSNYAATSKLMTINGSTYYFGSDSRMKTGLISTNGTKYYFGTNGVMVKEQSVTVNGNLYYFNADGTMFTGEKTINGETYYFDSTDGIGRLSADAQILKYVKAVISEVGSDLYSCYSWFVKTYKYQKLQDPYPTKDGYTQAQTYALYGFENHKGNCYCFAAGFYYVAKYLGYDATFVQAKTVGYGNKIVNHGWVEMLENGKTYVYDPELENELKIDMYRQPINQTKVTYIR
jgi:glucan-binding YG repeat protein